MNELSDLTESPAMPVVRRALGVAWWILIAAIVTPVLLIAGLFVTYQVEQATPEDYPRATPEAMGDRAARLSQEAYEVLGFDRAVPPGVVEPGVGTENSFSTADCYPGGLEGMADEPVAGAYRLSHNWELGQVPEREAVPGLRRLHDHLRETGWDITEYRELASGGDWWLRAKRDAEDGGEERLAFSWRAKTQRFKGGSTVPCAHDPAGEKDGGSVEKVQPPELH
ncbi:hypothetical protein [Streptomyces sp. NBC_01481]|uniref:hypothetical protein n=1 Tax=Streptomyces sp. NBC_01481 TaxID=2975869 RepID=UPI002250ABBD|nr:hypothetical protein [Streptomyces sp. NBC_01481]MCX4588096.1 hypothetical protein [Streptomyces sp. NBC_01481]